jgi:hypothetical protein
VQPDSDALVLALSPTREVESVSDGATGQSGDSKGLPINSIDPSHRTRDPDLAEAAAPGA